MVDPDDINQPSAPENVPDLATSPVRNMRISLIQTDLVWHEPEKNRENLSKLIKPLKGKTELIVLPEMFTSGFTMHPEEMPECASPSVTGEWMLGLAEECKCAIAGSIAALHPDGSHTNRQLFARHDGTIEFYDKRHLFQMGGEHEHYRAGDKRVVINYLDWKILLTTCYDLRFPVFCRNQNDYDLLLCVANWPAARRNPWRLLLQARAVENQAYVAGVNRIGTDGNGVEYGGDSMLVDFKGNLLIDDQPGIPFVQTEQLDAEALHEFKTKFPVWQDADEFEIKF